MLNCIPIYLNFKAIFVIKKRKKSFLSDLRILKDTVFNITSNDFGDPLYQLMQNAYPFMIINYVCFFVSACMIFFCSLTLSSLCVCMCMCVFVCMRTYHSCGLSLSLWPLPFYDRLQYRYCYLSFILNCRMSYLSKLDQILSLQPAIAFAIREQLYEVRILLRILSILLSYMLLWTS